MPAISFERADAKRTIGHRRDGLHRVDRRRDRWRSGLRVGRHLVEKRRRRHEEQVTGDGPAVVENAVVIARRPTDEHVFKHLLDRARRAAVADEVSTELALASLSERHVVADDFDLLALLYNRS